MINRRSTFFLGIFIFITPFLGVPTSWKTTFIVLSGLILIGLSIKIVLPKKTTRARVKRERATDIIPPGEIKVDSIPTDNTE